MAGRTTIVIPALNEAAVIGAVVRGLLADPALAAVGIREVLVVDNGSEDATAAAAAAAGARVIHEPRRGYGRACLTGALAATEAEFLILLDGDGSDDPADVIRVWQPVATGAADLAVGGRTRWERGALTPQQLVGNAVGATILRAVYGARVTDIGPLRAIRRRVLLRLALAEMTYGWSVEMLAKAGRAGLRVVEVPVSYRRRAGGQSKVAGTLRGTVLASWRIITALARYARWRPPPRRALFVVCRVPVAGQTKTRLARAIGPAAATKLYAAFLRDLGARLREGAARDGYDLWWYVAGDPAALAAFVPPGGALIAQPATASFGERLWQGFQELRARGYDQIAVLGSDSPQIPAARIGAAFAALDGAAVAFGPARDGGYYLLAQRGAPADLFTTVPLSQPDTGALTLARAAALGRSVALLPAALDVDEAVDLLDLVDLLRAAPSAAADPAPATLAALDALAAAPLEEVG